jgi:hypothetical protein
VLVPDKPFHPNMKFASNALPLPLPSLHLTVGHK